MLATVNGTPVHADTAGAQSTLALTVVVPANTRALILIEAEAGSVGSPFSFTSVVLGTTNAVPLWQEQEWNWKLEAWGIDAPLTSDVTVTVTAPSAVKFGATVIFLNNARSLYSAANICFAGSSVRTLGVTETTANVALAATPENDTEFLELNLVATTVNNETYTAVSPLTSIFAENTVATTNVHQALGSRTVPIFLGSDVLGTRVDQWTLGTTGIWAGISVIVSGLSDVAGAGAGGANLVQVDPTGFAVPPAATAPDVTPNGTAWNNSAWVQLAASADTDWLATGLCVVKFNGSGLEVEVDIGVGGAGSEVVITTFRFYIGALVGELSYAWIPSYIPINAIPSGSRVSVRMRKAGTSVAVWAFALAYLKKSSSSGKYVFASAQPTKCVPSAAVGTVIANSGVSWTNGAWSQMIASTSAAIVLEAISVTHFTQNATLQAEFDIGIGGAGSEVVISTLRFAQTGLDPSGGMSIIPVWPPLDAIPASTRVAIRMRANNTAGSIRATVVYKDKPL